MSKNQRINDRTKSYRCNAYEICFRSFPFFVCAHFARHIDFFIMIFSIHCLCAVLLLLQVAGLLLNIEYAFLIVPRDARVWTPKHNGALINLKMLLIIITIRLVVVAERARERAWVLICVRDIWRSSFRSVCADYWNYCIIIVIWNGSEQLSCVRRCCWCCCCLFSS